MSATPNNLQGVRRRIESAVERAQRAPGSVELVAVSKTFPASAVVAAMRAGQRAFGENYLQEALAKIDEVERLCADPAAGPAVPPPIWHFIGPIQSNKTRAIAERFDWVHSVDRLKVVERLAAQRNPARGPLNVLVEVNVDGEASKSGVDPDAVPALVEAVMARPTLAFRGLMAVPAPREDPDAQRVPFAAVRRLADALRGRGMPCDVLSMGMSADLEAAIAEGATMVRVGTAIFGARPSKPVDPSTTDPVTEAS